MWCTQRPSRCQERLPVVLRAWREKFRAVWAAVLVLGPSHVKAVCALYNGSTRVRTIHCDTSTFTSFGAASFGRRVDFFHASALCSFFALGQSRKWAKLSQLVSRRGRIAVGYGAHAKFYQPWILDMEVLSVVSLGLARRNLRI
jgi:hypothetical protein